MERICTFIAQCCDKDSKTASTWVGSRLAYINAFYPVVFSKEFSPSEPLYASIISYLLLDLGKESEITSQEGVVSERLILASCLFLSSEFSLFPAHCVVRFLGSCYSCSWASTAGRNSIHNHFNVVQLEWRRLCYDTQSWVSMPTSSFDVACPIRPHYEQWAYVLEWALPSIVLSHWGHCGVRAWDLVRLQPRVLRLSPNTGAASCPWYLVNSVCCWKLEFPHLYYANELD